MRRILLIILLFSLPIFASANDVPDPQDQNAFAAYFQPATSDVSMSLLGSIFGTVGYSLHGNGTIMGEIFGIFNLGVLSLSGIVLIYILFVSVLNTSYEGEMMGKDFHSMWVPLRAALAIGLMVPGSSGYNGMQTMVMWVVSQGVGVANQVWDVTLDHLLLKRSILTSGMTIDDNLNKYSAVSGDENTMATQAGQLLSAVSCMSGMQTILQQARDQEIQNYQNPRRRFNRSCNPGRIEDGNFWCNGPYPDFVSTVDVMGAQSRVISRAAQTGNSSVTITFPAFDESSPYAALNGVCGSMSFDIIDRGEAAEQLGGGFGDRTEAQLDNLEIARGLAVQQMFVDLRYAGQRIIRNDENFSNVDPAPPTIPLGQPINDSTDWGVPGGRRVALLNGGELRDAVSDYYNILSPVLNLILNPVPSGPEDDSLEFIDQARKDGWILAGSYYWNVALANRDQDNFYNDLDSFSVDTSPIQPIGVGLGIQNEALQKAMSNNALTQDQLTLLGGFLGNQQDDRFEENNTIRSYIRNAVQYGFSSASQPQDRGPDLVGLAQSSMGLGGGSDDLSAGLKGIIDQIKNNFNFSGGIFGWKSIFSIITSALLSVVQVMATLILSAINALLQFIVVMFSGEILNIVQQVQDTIASDLNPLTGLAQLGNIFLNSSVTLWTMGLFINAFLLINAGGILSGLMGLVAFLIPAMGSIILMLFTAGVLLAYYLPLLPYIIFTLGGVAWLIAVIEAMVAAPIVAMGLMYPEGHKVFGYAGDKTIMLLLNVFLRPSMMVIGFIASMLLAAAGVKLINMGFNEAMIHLVGNTSEGFRNAMGGQRAAQLSSVSGLVGVLVIVSIYVYLVWVVVEKSCQLIYLIPDKVLRWIGNGFHDALGQETSGMVQSMQNNMSQSASSTGQGLKEVSSHGLPEKKNPLSNKTEVS